MKKLFLAASLLLILFTKGQTGVKVVGRIVTNNYVGPFPTNYSTYGKGEHREVATMIERDAITMQRRNEGMTVYVTATKQMFQLKNGTANENWTELSFINKSDTATSNQVVNDTKKIVTWGNSLTAGQPDAQYPSQLAALTGCEVLNHGVGGQTSTQIAVRSGGITTNITISNGVMPASGGVDVSFFSGYEPITLQGPVGGIYGWVSGTFGLLTFDGSVYRFNRSVDSTFSKVVTTVPFIIDNKDLNTYPTIFEIGRNNLTDSTQVLSDLAAAVAHLGHNKYLIMSVINAQSEKNDNYSGIYKKIIALNAAFLRIYGSHFVDNRAYVISKYNPDLPQDIIDHIDDVQPTSLTYDGLHRNAKGYGYDAEILAQPQFQNILFPQDQPTYALFETVADGDWFNPATWLDGIVPTATSLVSIKNKVTLTANATCYSLKVEPVAGNLVISPGVVLTILH